MVRHEAHTTDAQGVVDVRDIILHVLGGLLQAQRSLPLAMHRLHHFGNIASAHIDTFQFALCIAEGVDGRVVVHFALQPEALRLVYLVRKLAEVDNRRRAGVLHLLQGHIAEEGVVLQQEALADDLVAVCYAKGLTRLLVDVLQHTVLVVIDHVEQRRVEHGVVTHEQLVDLLLLANLVGDVALDAQQAGGMSVLVAASHRHVDLVIQARLVVLGIALDGNHC